MEINNNSFHLNWSKLENATYDLEKWIQGYNAFECPAILINATPLKRQIPWACFSANPIQQWICTGSNNKIISKHLQKEELNENPWDFFRNILKQNKLLMVDPPPFPFHGGWIGYLGYGLTSYGSGPKLNLKKHKQFPDAQFGLYTEFFQINLESDEIYYGILTPPKLEKKLIQKKGYQLIEQINENCKHTKKTNSVHEPILKLSDSLNEYEKNIKLIHDKIKAGTIYQINYSRLFETKINKESWEIFYSLVKNNPEPYSAFLGFKNPNIILSSPEKFLSIREKNMETRPIKGTRPRGRNLEQDKLFYKQLYHSQKDRAELTMIVDVHRNDFGKVCNTHSIHVHENHNIEKHPSIFHMGSRITGKLSDEYSIFNAIESCFPAGSITGAPKYQAIKEIDLLENHSRESYTGALGYIDLNDNVDLGMMIRCLFQKNDKITFYTGGGIVIDSDPLMEFDETLHKAKPIIEALGIKNVII